LEKLNLFIPLTKVDEANRLVYGIAAEEIPDRPKREVFDYLSSKPNILAWSNEFAKVTGGQSFGNLRSMHQNISAGRLTDIHFDDDARRIEVVAEVVDDKEWEKVCKGVYTGFSFGGSYGRQWIDDQGMKRYTAIPTELSLGDYPAIPTAHFTMVKIGGGEVQMSFQKTMEEPDLMAKIAELGLTSEQAAQALSFLAQNVGQEAVLNPLSAYGETILGKVAKRGDASAKEGKDKYGDVEFADATNKKYPLDTEEHIRAAWNYINKDKNAAKYDAKDVKTIKAKIVSAWKEKIDKAGPPSAEEEAVAKIASAGDLKKYLGEEAWDVRAALNALDYLYGLFGSEQAENQPEAASQLADLKEAILRVKSFIASEIQETDPESGMDLVAGAANLAKTGASISSSNMKLVQAIHDHAASLGADCGGMEKIAGQGGLAKIAGLEADLQKIASENSALKARVVELEKEPVAPKAPVLDLSKLFTVEKDKDGQPLAKTASAQENKDPVSAIAAIHAQGGKFLS
jgi:hypothetical protein